MKTKQFLLVCALVCCSIGASGNPVDPDAPRAPIAPGVDPEHEAEPEDESEFEPGSEQPLEMGSPRPRPSTILNSAAAGVKRGIICSRCEGTGKVKQRKQTGVREAGRNQTFPVFSMVDVDCSTCNASCVQKPQAIRSQLTRAVEALATVDEDEKFLERSMALRDILRERVAPVAPNLRPILMDWYRDLARRPQDQQLGEVLVAFGSVTNMIDHQTFWIKDSTAGPLVIRGARLVHSLDDDRVMIAGLIAGFEKHRNLDTTVLERGLVISY